jgi:twinkle protein
MTIDMSELLLNLEPETIEELKEVQEAQEIKSPIELYGRVMANFDEESRTLGVPFPWSVMQQVNEMRPGELSLWVGASSSGKSLILGQVINHVLRSQTALIMSLEMKPEETIWRMIHQYAGCSEPSREIAEQFLQRAEGKLFIYDQVDSLPVDTVLAVVRFATQRMMADHLVIDSLMKCGVGRENYEAQAEFVNRLQYAAKASRTHIHLVCHVRKPDGSAGLPSKYDVRGAGEITDVADNIYILGRNKPKEAALQKQGDGRDLNEKELELLTQKDVYLDCAKNRHGGEERRVGLYFHKDSQQYLSQPYNSIQGPYPPPF